MATPVRRHSFLTALVVGSQIGACVLAGRSIPEVREATSDTTWETVDPGSTTRGTVTPEPEAAADTRPAQLTPVEMEELLRRKQQMRERTAKQWERHRPGPPGFPEKPVPETTVSRPPASE